MRNVTTPSLGAATSPTSRQRKFGRAWWLKFAVWTVVILSATLPILYLGMVSLTRQSDILGEGLFPSEITLENWPRAFAAVDFSIFLTNSLVAASGGAMLTIIIAVPGAYSMARHRLLGDRMLGIVVGTYIAPPVLAVFPLFYLLRYAGLTNSAWGLGIVYGMANVPVAVWLLEGFVRRLPMEIEEAARVDGCGLYRTLWHVVLPLLAPGIVAAGILCFVLGYNEFLFARFFSTSTSAQTIPIAISLFQGDRQVQFGQMAAVSLTALMPVYVLAVFFQRWLIEGLTSGAVK